MEELLHVSSSPHVRDGATTSKLMLTVVAALMPATLFGVYNFGLRAALVVAACVVSAVAAESLFCAATRRPATVADGSAVVTGLLLGLNLPVSIPLWICPLGAAFGIVVVKMLFGGLGQNFMNPALGARCFLLLSFAGPMSSFEADVYTGATPLAILKESGTLAGSSYSVLDLFVGTTAGTIGETSAAALIAGGVALIALKVIDWRIPASFIGSFAVLEVFLGGHLTQADLGGYVLSQLFGGGLMLGAFFMATDYVTSPITGAGRVLFGVVCGSLLFVFRSFGAMAEGCSYAIIFSNLLVPLIDRYLVPRPFGVGGAK